MSRNKKGILLLNLGTPTDCTVGAVRRYLREFLCDPRVIDLPAWIRLPLVYGAVLPFRPKRSAKAYQKVWDKEKGSPLLYHSRAFTEKLQGQLGQSFEVALGMRYQKPSIEQAIAQLQQKGCERIVVLPLFPQYSSAATGSALEKTFQILQKNITIPNIEVISEFYDKEFYLDAKSQLIEKHIKTFQPQKILFTYHSLPWRQIGKANPNCARTCQTQEPCPQISQQNDACYRAKCYATTQLLAQKLALAPKQYTTAFQSRLGRTRWVEPEVNQVLKELAQQGVKRLMVVCPSFVADCLETLEEIAIQAKNSWQQWSQGAFLMVPCLNDHDHWVASLKGYIEQSVS